jgi:uncharacterized protein YjdB
MIQAVSTGLTPAVQTGIISELQRTVAAGALQDVVIPPIGGKQTLLASLTVAPASGTLDISDGDTQQLTATGADGDGREYALAAHPKIEWESEDPDHCTVTGTGLVEPVGAGGPDDVTGTIQGQADAYACTVTA